MRDAVPDCCEVERGTGAVLLIAPHGGRRPPIDPCAPPANLRVNDVYTPEVTRALAERLAATRIINHRLDRNDVDLNRLSQVRRHAPWLLDLIAAEIEVILARHGRAEVLFVHGWNNGQLKCDIGLGGREHAGRVVAPPDARLTVSEDYLERRVAAFRTACESRGIAAPLGEKYPASHPNNLVQLFAGRGHEAARPDLARFATLASSAAVDALQLELTLPLRCPGEWRERFLDAATEAFASCPAAKVSHDDPAPLASKPRQPAVTTHAAESMQFYDPAADLGLFAGVGRMGPNSMGGRLLLFLGGQRIALFTGEETGTAGVPPLRFERRGHAVALRFHGPILVLEDAAEYLDLEAALAASRTAEVDLALEFEERGRAAGVATCGPVVGDLRIDGRRRTIATQGFGHVAALRAAGQAQTMLAATFGAERAFVGRLAHSGDPSSAVQFAAGAAEPLLDPRLIVTADGDAYTPAAFELQLPARSPLRAEALSRMAILRSAPHGYLRVAFGVARFEWEGLDGYGLYEHALPLAAVIRA